MRELSRDVALQRLPRTAMSSMHRNVHGTPVGQCRKTKAGKRRYVQPILRFPARYFVILLLAEALVSHFEVGSNHVCRAAFNVVALEEVNQFSIFKQCDGR